MYTLANLDFSERLGIVLKEVMSDDIDRQDQTLDARQSNPLDRALEAAVFAAA